MSLKEILEDNKNYYSHIGKSSLEKISYLMERNLKLESDKKRPKFINNIISKEGNKETIDIQYEVDTENIFSKYYDYRHNLDIQEQRLKYFSNVKNPCTYIEKKVKEGKKFKKRKIIKNENKEEKEQKPSEDKNKIKAKKELQKIIDSGLYFNYYHHLLHHTSDANYYSENIKNEIILGPDINATRYSPNLEYIYPKIIYSPFFKLMSGRDDKEKLSEKLKKQFEQKTKKNKENEKKLEKLNDNMDLKAKTQYKIPKIYYKQTKKKVGTETNENNENNAKDNNINTKDNKTGSNNNETIFTSNAIKNINYNESNTGNSNTISNNNNIILENELLTVKLSNHYRDKKHKNYRKINLINKNNLVPIKPKYSSSVSNIFKNSKIKNLSFRISKTPKYSNNNLNQNKKNINRNKLRKANSFQIKGPNFHKMLGRTYLNKLKFIEEPMHPQINPNWNSIQPKCIMKINYSRSPIQIKKINEFKGMDDEVTFDMNKLFYKYNNHFPAKSIYFNKMTGREKNEKEKTLPFYMFNLANRNSCDNFNEKSFKMNNFFEGRFKEPLSTFNQRKSFNYKLKMNIKPKTEKSLNLSTEEKSNKNNITNLFMKIIENNKNKRKKILVPKRDFISKILGRLPEFYRINLDSVQNKNLIDGITFKSYKKTNQENEILSQREKKMFLININEK